MIDFDLFFLLLSDQSLVQCSSVPERNLLADAERIVDKNNKLSKRRDGIFRSTVNDGLLALGYDASLCKSRWEKSPSFPAPGNILIHILKKKETTK